MAAALITPTPSISRPVRLARRCIERLQLSTPVDVYAVARACRLPILEQPPGGPDADAMLAYHSAAGRWAIFTNPSYRDPLRRRFTIAHEIGHYVLHRELIRAGHQLGERHEWEAHEFAGELLMPADEVLDCWRTTWADYEIRRRFGVSMSAWYRRLQDLGIHIHPRYR